jgi:hypothetical protein
MLKKVVLKEISFKEGVSKSGKAYTMVFITVGDKKASMYCDFVYGKKDLETAKGWKVGDEVELLFEQSNEYLNFSIPKRQDLLEIRIKALEDEVFKKSKK